VILCRASGLPERKHDLKRGVAVISGRASGLPKRKHDLKRRLALDLGLALAQGRGRRNAGARDEVQGRGRRGAGTRDEAQGRDRRGAGTHDEETDETDEIDETDEADETDVSSDEADETNVSSVQRDPAAGNVTQREAERLKNARALARSKKEFYLNPLESLPSAPGGHAGAADVVVVLVVLATTSSSLIFFHIHLLSNVLEKISQGGNGSKKRAHVRCVSMMVRVTKEEEAVVKLCKFSSNIP
jgi:hypothetical protein